MAVRKRLGEMLVEAGIIDETQLHAALGHQRQWGGRLGQCLVEMKLASEEAIVEALAAKFGFEVAPLDRLEQYAFEQAKALVPHEYAVKNSLFPVSADTAVLVVAMSDPTNLSLSDELAFRTGRRVKVTIAGERAIAAAIKACYAEGIEIAPAREAIALDSEDDGAMEAIYDPVGATSSEEMNRFYQAPTPQPAPAAAPTRVSPAAAPTAPAPRAVAPAPTAPAPARPRRPGELQLEDQPTGSVPLHRLHTALETLDEMSTEELQPLPLEGEPIEGEPLDPVLAEHVAASADAPPELTEWIEPPAAVEHPPLAEPPPEEEWVEGPSRHRELTAEEAQVLEELGRLAAGDDALPTIVRPSQLLATLLRLLLQKQLITEQELLDEILKG